MKDITNLKLNPSSTIKEAMEIIGKGAMKIALVVNEKDQLIGTLTDGDLRQAFLSGKTIEDTISNFYFKKPTFVDINMSKEEVLNLCISKKIYQIPIVNDKQQVIGIHILDELFEKKIYNNKVVLMVGGLGSRLRPLTESTPKPMLKVGGKPILHIIVEKFAHYGFKEIIMCVNYKSDIIIDYFGDGSKLGVNIEYIFEKKRMGTAGALSLLKYRPNEPFFVMNGDLLTNINFEHLLEEHNKNNSKATMCVREYDFEVPYGVVKLDENKNIKSIEEKPIHNFFVSAGIYMFNPECLDYIPKDKFYDIPSLFERLIEENEKTSSYLIKEYWIDIGRIEEYEKANEEYYKLF